MGLKTTVATDHGDPNGKTGARPSTQSVSPNGHPPSSPTLPAMSTSNKMLVMQNGSPIVTSINAIAEKSLAENNQQPMIQARDSDESNTDTVIHGVGHPMHSIHNWAAHTAMPPKSHTSNNFDRIKTTVSNRKPSPMSRMTSQLEPSENHTIATAAGDIRPYESIPQSFENDSIIANAELNSNLAVADSEFPQNARQFPITLPSLKPVARNDITALHQFRKADSDISTGEDSYGGGLTIPSVHTDLSGPPFCMSLSGAAQLANNWYAGASERSDCNSNEIAVYDENGGANGEISTCMPDDHIYVPGQASNSKLVSHTGGLPTHQKKYDDDDLYEASVTASESKTFKVKAEIHTHQASATPKNTAADSKPTAQINNAVKTPYTTKARTSQPKINRKPQMPSLAPCNPGCVICTILLPANKCAGCRRVQYCSAACQKADWEEHRILCGPQPSIKKSEERVNGDIQELMYDSQSEDFGFGDAAVNGEDLAV